MDIIPLPRFYVYALARPVKVKRHTEYRVFYVGKGTKHRVFDHENQARRGYKSHRHNIIRKVWREGGEIQRYILLTTDDEQEAFAYEREMIALHGRENLANCTDGEGATGYISTKEELARKSQASKRLHQDPVYRENFSRAMKKHWSNPVYYARVREKMNRAIREPSHRANLSAKSKAMWADPKHREKAKNWLTDEWRANLSAVAGAYWSTPEAKQAQSKRKTDHWQDPEYRQKVTAGIRASRQKPEFQAKMSIAMKEVHSQPEARAANSARVKALWQNPDYRKKIAEAKKKNKS
jgi:hypothetical protein